MSTLPLLNTKIYAGEYDVSGQTNAVTLDYSAEPLNNTTFASGGTKTHQGGAKSVDLQLGGFVDEGSNLIGEFAFNRIGTADVPITCIGQGNTAGDIAYFFKALKTSYPRPMKFGQLYAFSLHAVASNGPLVRGQLFVPSGSRTSSGTSSVVQLGATSSTQRLYAALHV